MACQLETRGPRGMLALAFARPKPGSEPGQPEPFSVRGADCGKDDLYGVMLIEEAPGGLRFRARRLEIITGIAQQAALAIQNDLLQKEMVVRERLETEVQLARQIQQTFIPESLPQFE